MGINSRVLGLIVLVTVASPAYTRGAQTAPATAQFTGSTDDQERRDQPVTEEDLRILQRADRILSSPAVWNRHDTRVCKSEDKTWSLFCAMEKASLDVMGAYKHREVALQEVRFAVEDATKGVDFHHRMMDYNNLSSTSFTDIKNILKVATERVRKRLAAQKKK